MTEAAVNLDTLPTAPQASSDLMADLELAGIARTYNELLAALREIANASPWSREEIDRRGNLPDGFASKILSPVPVGSCRAGPKTMGRLLDGLNVVLIVARRTKRLDDAADLAVEKRQDRIHAKLLDQAVFQAAKTRLASENGKRGAAVRWSIIRSPQKRAEIARHAARARWRRRRSAGQATP